MPGRSFVDTNIFVYTDDHDAPDKQTAALDLIAELRRAETGVVSTQVLQEYFVVVTGKLGVPAAIARRKVELLARHEVIVLGTDHILAAIDFTRIHSISFWDALIVQAAKAANCSVLYTEDLQHGSSLDGLEIVNPFADAD
jgi:predicted nucleic acid-binding protein